MYIYIKDIAISKVLLLSSIVLHIYLCACVPIF